MPPLTRVMLAAILFLAAPAFADNPFDLARKPKQTVFVALTTDTPPDLADQPPMLRRIGGILGELKGQQIIDLCTAVDTKPIPATAAAQSAARACIIRISGPAGSRDVAIDQFPDGTYIAQPLGADATTTKPSLLKRAAIDALLDALNDGAGAYPGPFDAAPIADPIGSIFEIPHPYRIAPFTLDGKTLHDRVTPGAQVRFDPMVRDLNKEHLFARLPKGYDPRSPAGLLVWMDPSPGGRPPQPLYKALDQYGFICIGAGNTGNDRPVADRLQLALDAVATAKRRWHIDHTRIYVTGVSGGGKMSSMLLPAFPEVFDGAVAIVGLACYKNTPTDDGRMWAAEYGKPTGKRWTLFLQRRTAAVTGDQDFNHAAMLSKFKAMESDKVDIRFYDTPGMGHTFPTPDDFAAQLGWVDERPRAAHDQAIADAAAALPKAKERPDQLDFIKRYPWTPAAWQAALSLPPLPVPTGRGPG